jgi:hypothetical protein
MVQCDATFAMHLPWEAKIGGPTQFKWMHSQERELKKPRVIVRNKARVEGCIAEAFACKEIMNFSRKYFSCAVERAVDFPMEG